MSEWQPIETAPKDGRELLGVDAEGDMGVMFYGMGSGRWLAHAFAWTAYAATRDLVPCEPTHWMPLPEPPK